MRAGQGPGASDGPPPRVALVHDWLTGMRGGEKVLEALGALYPEAPVFTLFHFPGSVSAAIERHPIQTSFLARAPGLRRHYRRYLPLFPAAIEGLDLAGFDLVISSSHCVAKGIIPPPEAFHLCYCHTPMRYAWDQERAYFPRRRGPGARLRGMILTALRAWDAASASRVHLFVANSRFVADRIRNYYGREAEVVPPPVEVDFFTPGPSPPAADGGYALMVSALAPYKKVETAIAACDRLGLELRIVGSGPERRRLERLGGGGRDGGWAGRRDGGSGGGRPGRRGGGGTRFLGQVGAESLRELYRGARVFLQPGIEDFGIAAVEALASGKAVIALGQGGVLESAPPDFLYVQPEEQQLDQAIARFEKVESEISPTDLQASVTRFSEAEFLSKMSRVLSQRSCETVEHGHE